MDLEDNSKFLKDSDEPKQGTDESIKALSRVEEKELYTDVNILDESNLPAFDIGNVFESDPRLIDLGEDGKERPIRACRSLPPTYSLSNIRLCLLQKPTQTTLFDWFLLKMILLFPSGHLECGFYLWDYHALVPSLAKSSSVYDSPSATFRTHKTSL